MKKIIIVVCCLLVVAIYAGYLAMRPVTIETRYSDYLPQDTVATVRLTRLAELADAFPSTALGRFLAKETMHEVLSSLGFEDKAVREYDQLYDSVAGVMTNPAFRQVFGDDAVAALFKPEREAFKENPAETLENSLVVFAATNMSGPLEALARLLMSDAIDRQQVDGRELTRIRAEDGKTIYGYADDGVVLLAYNPQRIDHCLRIRSEGGGLTSLPAFGRAKEHWQTIPDGRDYARIFVGAPAVRSLLEGDSRAEAEEARDYLEGVDYLASSFFQGDNGLRLASRAGYGYDRLNPATRATVDAASTNSSLHLVTADALAYSWSSSLTPEMVRKALESAGEGVAQALADQVEEELGMDLERVYASFGPQYGLLMNGMVSAGFFSVPKLHAFVEVRDKETADAVLAKALDVVRRQGIGEEKTEDAGGFQIHYWQLLPGDAAQPAVVLTDAMLHVANGKESLAASLFQEDAGSSLPQATAELLGVDLAEQLASANYGAMLWAPDRMADAVGGLVEWLVGIAAASRGISPDRAIEEVLRLLHAVDMVVGTSSLTREYAISDLVIRPVVPEAPQ